MLGGMAAKWRWRAKRAGGGQADRPAEHGVRAGAGRVAQVRQVLGHRDARGADVARATTRWTPTTCSSAVDENTIFVVPTLGVTYTGAYEPVKPLADGARPAAGRHRASTSTSTSTGPAARFLAPFCAPDVEWDFRLPRVKSISTSGHKFGLAPLGVGWVVWRDVGRAARRPHLPRELPRRRHAGVPDQLLPAGRPDRRAVLRLPPARAGGLPPRAHGVATTPAGTSPRRSRSSDRSS